MKLYETLERYGFVSEDDSVRVWDLPEATVSQIYDSLYSELRTHQYDGIDGPKSRFSFVASANMRADIGCQEPFCVRQKLEFLAHYATLYCDLVFLPLPLFGHKGQRLAEQRDALERSIRSLGILRPVIEGGLIRPVTRTTSHCIHMLPFVKDTKRFVDAVTNDLQSDTMGEFSAVYQRPEASSTGQPSVYLSGPEDLIEHGELVGLYPSPPFWVSKSWRYNLDGKHAVPKRKLRCIYRINEIFDKIASDTTFHLAFGSPFRARYLTNQRGEATVLEWLTGDEELVAANEAVEKLLSHVIPVIGDLPLRNVVALRKKEPDAFARYRDALTKITDEFLRDRKHITKRVAAEIFHDYIESEVRRIQQAITSKRKSAAKQFVAGAAGLFATVAIGAFALPIAQPVVDVIKTGGAMLLGNAARECLGHSDERSNDFYFLLRLSHAADKRA